MGGKTFSLFFFHMKSCWKRRENHLKQNERIFSVFSKTSEVRCCTPFQNVAHRGKLAEFFFLVQRKKIVLEKPIKNCLVGEWLTVGKKMSLSLSWNDILFKSRIDAPTRQKNASGRVQKRLLSDSTKKNIKNFKTLSGKVTKWEIQNTIGIVWKYFFFASGDQFP